MAKKEQKHGMPALISFIVPGVGQIIKGHIMKGIGIMILMVISILLIFVVVGLITTPIFWLWNVYDAYNSNKKGI